MRSIKSIIEIKDYVNELRAQCQCVVLIRHTLLNSQANKNKDSRTHIELCIEWKNSIMYIQSI